MGKLEALTVGSYSTTYPAYIETSGNFSLKKEKSEFIGSMTSSFDTATFGVETKITLQVKTASHPTFNDYFYFMPIWSETDSDMEDIFSESTLDATVSFTSVLINDSQRRELSSETKDLTGLTPEQINPEFTWKKISTYE